MPEHKPLRSRAPSISTDHLIRVQTTCLLVIAGGIAAAALYLLQPVMIPLALALVTAYALAPGVDFLTDRCHIPRMFSVMLALAVVAGFFGGIGYFVGDSIDAVVDSSDAYEQALIGLGRDLGIPLQSGDLAIDQSALTGSGWKVELWRYAADAPIGQWAGSLADGLFGMVTTLGLVIVFALFMLVNDAEPRFHSLRARVARRVKRYLAVKFLLSLVTGVLVGVSLAVIGIDLAFLVGVLTFALNFIPNVGPLIAIALPLPLAFLADDPGQTLLLVLLIPGLVQFLIGNIIEPRYLGHELRLHPVSVLAALVFWGMLWGVPGLLLAVPLTTAVHIAAGETELTRPIADLLSGRFLHPDRPEPPPTMPPQPAIEPRKRVAETG